MSLFFARDFFYFFLMITVILFHHMFFTRAVSNCKFSCCSETDGFNITQTCIISEFNIKVASLSLKISKLNWTIYCLFVFLSAFYLQQVLGRSDQVIPELQEIEKRDTNFIKVNICWAQHLNYCHHFFVISKFAQTLKRRQQWKRF